MKYDILKNVVDLLEQFEQESSSKKTYRNDVEGFKSWIASNYKNERHG